MRRAQILFDIGLLIAGASLPILLILKFMGAL